MPAIARRHVPLNTETIPMTITAPISDEQFETLLSNIAPESAQASLRARDTTQRAALARYETVLDGLPLDAIDGGWTAAGISKRLKATEDALARVEAEAGRLAEAGLAAQVKATTAQAELAEMRRIVAGFLFNYDDGVGKPWERRLLNYARKLVDAKEFNAQAEQQEAPKRGRPDWSSHGYDQIFQTSDGNWFGARAGWDFKGHISDQWKGREVSLLRDDGGFLAYGEPNPDWESSLEQRPAQEAQGAQAGDDAIKLFERIISQSPADLDKATEDNPWYQVMASEVRAFAAALSTKSAVQINPEPVAHLTVEVRGRSTKVDIEWPNGLHTTLPAGEYPLYTAQPDVRGAQNDQ